MDRDQILRMLGERETVGRAEVARLGEEAARVTVLIEGCRREVERLATAREVLSGWSKSCRALSRRGMIYGRNRFWWISCWRF